MDGTSIVSLPAEENMLPFDLESNYGLPLAEFLPTPLSNDLPHYPAPANLPFYDSDDYEDEQIEGCREMSHLISDEPITMSHHFEMFNRQFENLPLQPLPRSTAAELSWLRTQPTPSMPLQFSPPDNAPMYSEDDSDESLDTSYSHSTEPEDTNMFVSNSDFTNQMNTLTDVLPDDLPDSPVVKGCPRVQQKNFRNRTMHSLEQRSEYEDMEIPPQNSPQQPNVSLSPGVKTEKLLDVNKNIDRDLKPPFNLFREVSLPVIPSAKKLKKERKKGKFKVKREKVRDPPIQDMGSYKKVTHKHTPGKKPKLKNRWTLMCGHCGKIFNARPTPKNSRYVVNHICPKHGNKRKQFVIGTKARRCMKEHDGPCIQQLLKIQ
jgi:hypothetical protein